MDNTKIFILQCEKAVEIQAIKNIGKNPHIGDYVFLKGWECSHIIIGLDEFYDDETWKVKLNDSFYEDAKELTWIPTQSDLQGMDDTDRGWLTLSEDFYIFCKDHYSMDDKYWLTSMEQLWLAFVMLEKYNKIWDGKNWIHQNQL